MRFIFKQEDMKTLLSRANLHKASGLSRPRPECTGPTSPYDYDLYQIAKRRQHNARFLLQLLADSTLPVEPLHTSTPDGVVPQSLPVIVSTRSRDEIYFEMNSFGFGVVSLYHTLIQQITSEEFPESQKLSRHILNLPVHQDINDQELIDLVHCLGKALA